MKIYLLMLSENYGQNEAPLFAYYDKEKARAHADEWNKEQEKKDRENAEKAGKDYDDWVGACPDYVFVQQVEIIS